MKNMIIQELLETGTLLTVCDELERAYVKKLLVCIQYFLNPMRNNKVVSKQKLQGIFGNLEEIFDLNQSLLKQMEERFQLNPTPQLADLFIQASPIAVPVLIRSDGTATTIGLRCIQVWRNTFTLFPPQESFK